MQVGQGYSPGVYCIDEKSSTRGALNQAEESSTGAAGTGIAGTSGSAATRGALNQAEESSTGAAETEIAGTSGSTATRDALNQAEESSIGVAKIAVSTEKSTTSSTLGRAASVHTEEISTVEAAVATTKSQQTMKSMNPEPRRSTRITARKRSREQSDIEKASVKEPSSKKQKTAAETPVITVQEPLIEAEKHGVLVAMNGIHKETYPFLENKQSLVEYLSELSTCWTDPITFGKSSVPFDTKFALRSWYRTSHRWDEKENWE